MIRFKENFLGNQISAMKKKQEEQKEKMIQQQQNMKNKMKEGKQLGQEVKVKVEDWLRGKKGEAPQSMGGVTDLKTRWLLAQQQKRETQKAYNKAEKNYYTFSKGGLWYQNYLEDKAGVNVNQKAGNIEERFNQRTGEIKKLIQVYKEKDDNKNNVAEMNKTIQGETNQMAEKVSFGLNTKNINNRMSDWYEEQNIFYENINWYVSRIYWISLLVMSVLVLIKFKVENKKLLAVIVLFIVLPFLTNYFAAFIFDLHNNNCPTYIPSLGFESGKSKTCQVKPTKIPVDCVEGNWGSCNRMCGGGKQFRKGDLEPMYGGRPCGESSRTCNPRTCKPGEDPKPPPPDKPKPSPPTDNVLIQMTKKYWNKMHKQLMDLGNAKLQKKTDICKKEQSEMPSMLSAPSMGKMGDFGKDALSSAKNLGQGALDQAQRVKQKSELLADTAAKKAGNIKDDINASTEDRFDIISQECLGKYCR